MMNTQHLLPLILVAGFATACGADTNDDKGSEDNPLTGGKADSFRVPTEHGTLLMGAPNNASLSDDEQFHAWEFTLTGDATIDISTKISKNLDTVMYLYHRTSPDDSWGRFKRKNDDDDGQLSSRIVHEASKGEWRVIVKGFKQSLRGSFSVLGECEGDGCKTSDATCSADSFQDIPSSTDFTDECAFDIAGVLADTPISEASSEIGLSEKCSLSGLELKAIDFYHEYWSGFLNFEDQFGTGDPDEDIFLQFNTVKYPRGTEITVDAFGDEDGLTMLFDSEDRLLSAYQHNQSPTIDYYCGDRGTKVEFPDETCYEGIMAGLPQSETSAREFGETTADATTGHEGIQAAVRRFVEGAGFDQDEVISTESIEYTTLFDEPGVIVNLIGPDDISAEYTAYLTFRGWRIVLEADANGVAFVCE